MPAKPVTDALTSNVDEVLARMAEVLGPDWMAGMEVQPETVRTWRKRGEVPARQLLRASQRAGRPLEYFNGTGAAKPVARHGGAAEDEFTQIEMLDAHVSAGHGAVNGPDEVIGRFAFRTRSEERRVGKECRSRWSPYH